MTQTVAADYSFEIEVRLSGTYVPGQPETGPTYDCGGAPAEPAMIEDRDILEISGLVHDSLDGKSRWTRKSLLDGVDRKSAAYAQIVNNILAFIGDDADDALIAEAQ